MLDQLIISKPSWSIENAGGRVHIDDYDNLPKDTIAVIDIETNEGEGDDFRIVCIGLTTNGTDCYIYFDIRPELLHYLRNTRLVAHGSKNAEIPWLERYGISIDSLEFDTQVGYYVYDSSKKSYGLKKILENQFNVKYPTYKEITAQAVPGKKKAKHVTLDTMPKELVAEYNACDVFYTYKLWLWLRQNYTTAQLNFLNTIEFPMYKLIYEMEQLGVKIDTNEVRRIHRETSKERRKAKTQLFNLAGRSFNPNSWSQVLEILNKMGIPVKSTNEDVISKYKENPFIETLLSYRGLQKLCSTYTIPLYFNAVKSPDSRIHARFQQNTITGRLSSSDPVNLQNQPKEIRSCFVAKDGHNLIGADWSNIEWRIPAHFSGQKELIEVLSDPNGDLHKVTAKFLFGEAFSEVNKVQYTEMRQKAKTCNFLLTNSGTAKRLATELVTTELEATKLYDAFWSGYSVLAAWIKKEKELARRNGGVATMFGRWVPIPQLSLTCGNWNCAKSNRFCKQCFLREEAERQAISCLVQGSASDLMKLSAIRLKNDYGLVPILSVHDELVYEIPNSDTDEVKEQIRHIMENLVSLKVPLKVEIKVGKDWRNAH